ncbi:hypothetical protein E2C01_083535 [Portunus trituberculatus]|uniref:Uncharacterized protein n=1 Tax=Portunus trituberculatus TaxID=210409 RepID=A0A5B7J218_PORTR|nr:hypothetical protein [Portunus trituberculatus]
MYHHHHTEHTYKSIDSLVKVKASPHSRHHKRSPYNYPHSDYNFMTSILPSTDEHPSPSTSFSINILSINILPINILPINLFPSTSSHQPLLINILSINPSHQSFPSTSSYQHPFHQHPSQY